MTFHQQLIIVDFETFSDIDSQFPNEFISQIVIPYDNASGALSVGEMIRNYKLDYGNNVVHYRWW